MKRVVVTGALSSGGLQAVRELGRAGLRVVAADTRGPALGLRSRYAERHVRIPPSDDPGHGAALLDLCRATRADAILPLASRSVGAIAAMRDRFAGVAAVPVPPAEAFAAAFDKGRTMEACERLGIPVPGRDARPGGRVVVKPAFDAGGARGLTVCATPAEVDRARAACRARWGDALVQEYVPGGPESMRCIVLVFDTASRLVARFTLRKVRTHPADGGLTALGVSTDEAALVDLVLPLFERWRWQGPAEVELKVDPRDGKAKLIEVNPRLPGYFPVADSCGLPLAEIAVRAALGEAPPRPPPYEAGVRHLNPGLWLKAVAAELRGGPDRIAVLRRALQELRVGAAPRKPAGAADPWPRIGKILQEGRNALFGRSA